MVRKRIYEILELGSDDDIPSKCYDFFIIIAIVISIIPLAFKEQYACFNVIDKITVFIFIIDYILRWFTADFKYKHMFGFIKYPFGFMAIIDLISILPSLTLLNSSFRLFKLFRLFRSVRVIRIFKIFRYSKSIRMILNVFKAQKDTLSVILGIAVSYILISALIIINVEPDTFSDFFDAVYWATISLTTVGYGDIYPVSTVGKVITMISSVLGIAIVALPAGVITSGMMDELNKQ